MSKKYSREVRLDGFKIRLGHYDIEMIEKVYTDYTAEQRMLLSTRGGSRMMSGEEAIKPIFDDYKALEPGEQQDKAVWKARLKREYWQIQEVIKQKKEVYYFGPMYKELIMEILRLHLDLKKQIEFVCEDGDRVSTADVDALLVNVDKN